VRRAIAVAALLLTSVSLLAADAGKAKGQFVVSRAKHALKHAYGVEKNKLVRIVLSTGPLEEQELFETAALQDAVSKRNVSAIVVQLDEDGYAESTFFFDAKLPAGLEVRELGRFEPVLGGKGTVAGRVVLDDSAYSFGYDATFEAKVVVQPQTVRQLAADATPADHALWRLEQKEVPFDEDHYRRAAMDGDVDTVKLFLTAGMPVDAAGAVRTTVDVGKADVVKLMLESGAACWRAGPTRTRRTTTVSLS
jgi:hypothetical protein